MIKQKSKGHKRLAKLATFLYSVPRSGFDMRRWKYNFFGTLSLKASECNTLGCAVGWSTLIFADEGFILDGFNEPRWQNNLPAWPSVEKFFGIGHRVCVLLFANTPVTANMGPRQVANRIRKFLKTGKV